MSKARDEGGKEHGAGCPFVADDESDFEYLGDAGQCTCGALMSEIQDEAYVQACEEIDRLHRLVRRTVAALESYPILPEPGAVLSDLIAELRKAVR